ncbi:Gfo/Idh/MocA family oxidoreductase [candidate division KSB1 bacterium]|nr:Gfo/Idh/MocA family oxidoreductase [candidate division KSB1 bacterium]RQW10201.1 MAG: gfo/Idh/MocA family oxidoreductase [candidate division KSB1 bacterium]
MGMVGGGPGAFIGDVHRKAARLDGQVEIVGGAFDIDPAKSHEMGRILNLEAKRVHDNYEKMIEAELALSAEERIDFVSITTPNNWHFPVAKAFLEAGFNVICEKPMTMDVREALELKRVVERSGKVFALLHNYTGYPMVKHARWMVREGKLGRVQKVVVEYPQDWLLKRIELEGQQQASWRTDPKQAGAGGCLGDIGTHAENLAHYITGLDIEELSADLTSFARGRLLDDDVNVLLRYENGAKGVLHSSQISTGEENNLNIRVWGTEGALRWHQENPNYLYYYQQGEPVQILRRGNGYICEAGKRATRIPTGHPEAFLEAFANIYMNAIATMRAAMVGEEASELERDFPTVDDGLEGMQFIETVVASSKSKEKWERFHR